MNVIDLNEMTDDTRIKADVIIIGGGLAGIILAKELFHSNIKVVILESGGLEETAENEKLNAVENTGDSKSDIQMEARHRFHGANTKYWSDEIQAFGVRCRVVGGSTVAWAGKSAPFDPIDFERRSWIANSGWPLSNEELEPFVERAAAHLNLGPAINDQALWSQFGVPPDKILDQLLSFRSYFWQFARSISDPLDVLRIGADFIKSTAKNVHLFINSTVTQLHVEEGGARFGYADVSSTNGSKKVTVEGSVAVIAAGAIENARLLLMSRAHDGRGIGNLHDNVGRYLMDHPSARVGSFTKEDCEKAYRPFRFLALRHNNNTHMYMHGMAMRPDVQAQDRRPNCAFYFLENRARDDPWDAIKRLLKRTSNDALADFYSALSSPRTLVIGIGRKMLQSAKFPDRLKKVLIDIVIALNPNFVVREFLSGGLPHKLDGLYIDVITEQPPLRDNRITLSDKKDRLGLPIARVRWSLGVETMSAIADVARRIRAEFVNAGLPEPKLERWVLEEAFHEAPVIDMAHTAGTTRMSLEPEWGVVDENCMVHGVSNLYVAGASVFPTSGHANPTLMIAALTVRLADKLKALDLAQR